LQIANRYPPSPVELDSDKSIISHVHTTIMSQTESEPEQFYRNN